MTKKTTVTMIGSPKTIVTITRSPNTYDDDLPWIYGKDDFVSWVEEVFLESYKRDIDHLTFQEAVNLVEGAGYSLVINGPDSPSR